MAERRRLLIVDDDAPIRAMLATVAARKDLDIEIARDGAEAIERINHDGYDVIVLDLMMPRVDGFAVLDHIRQTQPHKLRRTIVASAIPEKEVTRQLPVAVYRIHTKPFDIRALMADIDECIYSQTSRQTDSAVGNTPPAS